MANLPDFTTQTDSVYKAAIDETANIHDRLAGPFYAHAQATPDMTVAVDAGRIPKVGALATEVAATSTSALVAPSTNPRNDIVHIDVNSGAAAVATGTEAASPTDPAVPAGKIAIARVRLTVGMTQIADADIDDLRSGTFIDINGMANINPAALDDEIAAWDTSAVAHGSLTINNLFNALGLLTELNPADAANDFVPVYDTSAAGMRKVRPQNLGSSFPAGTKMLFQQTAAPTGWTKVTASGNNNALRVTTGTVGSGGVDGFTTVFGTGKTTASHILTVAEMPAHSHTIDTHPSTTFSAFISKSGDSPSTSSQSTNAAGGGGGHSHNLSNFDLAYTDVIVATKD